MSTHPRNSDIMTVSLPPELLKRIKAARTAKGFNQSAITRLLWEEWLRKNDPEHEPKGKVLHHAK